MKYKISEAFSNVLPPLSDEAYTALEKDILLHGILHPLIIWNGYVIDGHHRIQIAEKHNIDVPEPPIVMDTELSDEDDAVLWIIDYQKGRRNMSDIDLADLYRTKYDILKKKGKEKMSKAGATGGRGKKKGKPSSDQPFTTREALAKELGWSETKTAEALFVINNATEDEMQLFKDERYKIGSAHRVVKDRMYAEKVEEQDIHVPTEEEIYEQKFNQIIKAVDTCNSKASALHGNIFGVITQMDELEITQIDPSLLTLDLAAQYSLLFQAVSRMLQRFGIDTTQIETDKTKEDVQNNNSQRKISSSSKTD